MKKTSVIAGTVAGAAAAMFLGPAVAAAAPPKTEGALAGKTVFLDPALQGAKATGCQATGPVTAGGIAAHTINWNVASLVKAGLESQGAKVVLSRADDKGTAACADERVTLANESKANLAVTIDTVAGAAKDSGFVLLVGPKASAATVKATNVVRDTALGSGIVGAAYGGANKGVVTSALAVPTTVPQVDIDLGNVNNATDAALLTSVAGQTRYAFSLVNGIGAYLTNKTVAGQAVTGPVKADPIIPAVPSLPGATQPSATVPAATVPGATTPTVTVPTAPTATAPTATVPGATTPTATAPLVPGVPLLTDPGTGTTTVPTATVPTATVPGVSVPTATTPGQASVTIPGLGTIALPNLAQTATTGIQQGQIPGVTATALQPNQLASLLTTFAPMLQKYVKGPEAAAALQAIASNPQALALLTQIQGQPATASIVTTVLSQLSSLGVK